MLEIDLASQVPWIERNVHRGSGEDAVDRGAPDIRITREAIDGVTNDLGDGDVPPLRFDGQLGVTRLVEQQVHPSIQVTHAHTLVHLAIDAKTGRRAVGWARTGRRGGLDSPT